MERPAGRWGAVLNGERSDLEDWGEDLKPPVDPAVPPVDPTVVTVPDHDDPNNQITILMSTEFDVCTSAAEVREIAIPLIRTLSGLIGVRRRAKPIRFEGVIEFKEDGSWSRPNFAEVDVEEGRDKVRGTASTGAGQKLGPTYAQALIALVSGDLRDALEHYDRADNWHDLYKAYEAVEDHVGGRDEVVRLGFKRDDLKSLTLTAQHFRHHKCSTIPKRHF